MVACPASKCERDPRVVAEGAECWCGGAETPPALPRGDGPDHGEPAVSVIPPAFRPCATRRNKWLRTTPGSSAPPTMRQVGPSGGRCSQKDLCPPASGLRRV